MQPPRRVEIRKKIRLFDDFFKIDEVIVAHEQHTGTMSLDQRRLIFERGDSVAVLLLDLDAKSVVLTEQFRIPTLVGRRRDDPSTANAWITEAIAGMVEANETPEAAAIRETMEETGYRIRNPKLIAKFFSSPGGASERIFLYFAKARGTDKLGEGGGEEDEDIKIVPMPLVDLFDRLENGSIEDPKLAIGAYWLQNHLQSLQDLEPLLESLQPRDRLAGPATQPASVQLDPSTVRYAIKDKSDLIVGYKTGPIQDITGVSIWVNSENTDMMMDRFLGKTISAKIRFLGANKNESNDVVEDTIEEALRNAAGQWAHVKTGTVLVTESGSLRSTHQVRKIFHVATVEGGPGEGVKADPTKLKQCMQNALTRADRENKRFRTILFSRSNLESILIPMLGCGDGGLPVEEVAQTIIPVAVNYFRCAQIPTLKEIYFLAFKSRDEHACKQVFEQFCLDGVLVRVPEG